MPNAFDPSWYQSGMQGQSNSLAGGDPWAPLMDPFERAAYGVRRRYGTSVPGPPGRATPQEHAQAALMLMGPVGAAIEDPRGMARLIPTGGGIAKAAGGGATSNQIIDDLIKALAPSAQAAPGESKEQIMERQKKLQAANFYSGKLDGEDGPATQAAQRAFDAAETERKRRETSEAAEKQTREIESMKAGAAATQAATDKARADNEKAALELAERNRIAKERGNQRFQDVEKDVPWTSQVIRDYATPAGLAAGGLLGSGLRFLATKGVNALNRSSVATADALFAGKASGIPNRTARVNEFWRAGGAGPGEVPYLPTPGRNPGSAANENALALEQLYQPNKTAQKITDYSVLGGQMGESLLSQFMLQPDADARLERAINRLKDDPSDANIKELQAAKDNAAMIRFVTNVGRGGAGAYLTGMKVAPYANLRPSMQAADAERQKVDALLRAHERQRAALPGASAELPSSAGVNALQAPVPTRAARRPTQSGGRPLTDQWWTKY